MADNRQRLVHLHTSDVKMPAQGLLDLGEIAVQHNDVEAALYIEKNNGEIAKFIDVTAVEAKIEVEKLRAEGAEEALADKIETLEGSNHTHENKGVLDGITAEKVAAWDAAEANAIADAEAKYQVKGEYEAAGAAEAALEAAKADAADKYQVKGEYEAAGAAAQALADAKADAEAKYQVKGEYEAAGAAAQALVDAKAYSDELNNAMDERVDALEGSNHTHENKAELDKIVEGDKAKWDDAVSRLDNFLIGTGTVDVVDTLQDIKTWMEGEGVVATELTEAIAAEAKLRGEADEAMDTRIKVLEGYNHDAYIAADAQVLADAKADAEAKYQVKGEYEAAGAAAQALADAKADAEAKYQVKGEYEAAGAAAQALADAKADAEAKYQVKGEYEVAGAAAQALADAKADAADKYQVKGEYEVAGAADTALEAAKSYSDGNLATAKAYVDGKVDGKFDEVGAAAQALTDAKTYTDEKLSVIKIDCGTY